MQLRGWSRGESRPPRPPAVSEDFDPTEAPLRFLSQDQLLHLLETVVGLWHVVLSLFAVGCSLAAVRGSPGAIDPHQGVGRAARPANCAGYPFLEALISFLSS